MFDPKLVKSWDFVNAQRLTQPILECYKDATEVICPDSTVKFEHCIYPSEQLGGELKHNFFLVSVLSVLTVKLYKVVL